MDKQDIDKLTYALETVLDPTVEQSKRTAAINLCETYKNHAQCSQIGFALAETQDNLTVRYFGWQLIKHVVRHRWTEQNQEFKVEIQKRLLRGVGSCPSNAPLYLRSVISSVLNELAKHVWPQQWPSMLQDVFALCDSQNISATEIILLLLLSLTEDVVLYQNVTVKLRARDLRQAMTAGSRSILDFLQNVITQPITTRTSSNRLGAVALRTLEVYVEWVNIDCLFLEGSSGSVVVMLYKLLDPTYGLHVDAAKCLLAMVDRKGQIPERQTLLKLAENDFVEKFVRAIQSATTDQNCDETAFLFLKISGKVMGALAGHVIAVLPEPEKNKVEFSNTLENYKPFLDVLFRLANHDSRVVAQPCVTSWVSLLRHPELRKEPTLLLIVPHLLDLITKHLCKDYTQQGRFTAVEELDFSDDEEILRFMKTFRSSCIELLRFSTLALPLEVTGRCFETVYANLAESSPTKEKLHLRFEGLLTYLETVTGSVVTASENWNSTHKLPVAQAEQLLYLFATKNPGDPDLQRIFFHSALALCKLVALSSEPLQYFKLLFDRAFEMWDETAGRHREPDVSSLRRAVGVLIIRLSKYYPAICFALMDHLKSTIMERLQKKPGHFSPFEKVSMFESLVLLSNEWKNLPAQSALVKDIIDTAAPLAQSGGFQNALQSTENFASAVGLGLASQDPASANLRSDIYYYVTLASALLCRSQIPDREEDKVSGGFSVDGILNHPCVPHVGPAVEHIFVLARHFSSMWSGDVQSSVHPNNMKALAIKESERRALVSSNAEPQGNGQQVESEGVPRHYWETLQTFLQCNLSNCYNVLGLASKVFANVFYYQEIVYQTEVRSLLQNVACLPAPQLRCMLRQFLTPFFKNCPNNRVLDVASPVLTEYCGIVMHRLRPQWENFAAKEAARVGDAFNHDRGNDFNAEKPDEEILDEQLLRVTTREHLDLLVSVCVNKNPPSKKETAPTITSEDKCLGMSPVAQLSQLGTTLSSTPACEHVLIHALVAMSWHDTSTCHKSVALLWPLLKLLMQQQAHLFTGDVSRFVFEGVLRGLHRHGQSDACQTQLASLALMLISGLPDSKGVFRGILVAALPQKEAEILKLLDTFQQQSEKQRKAAFKKLVCGFIERHVGEKFKEDPKMDIFAPFFARGGKRPKRTLDEVKVDGLARLFQPQ